MNTKFLVAGVAGFIISLAGGFLVHGMLLHPDYALVPNLMRTEADAQAHFPFMLLSHFIKGFAFAWVYSKGISSGVPWSTQGFRFGFAAAFLITVPLYLIYFAVQPMPGMLVVKQIIFDSVVTVIMGLVVAFIYRSSVTSE